MSLSPPSAPLIRLILGSRNRKKCREMADLIAPPWERRLWMDRVEIGSLDAYPDLPEVVEDAPDFAGNARKKASETARAVGAWVLADDSGLAVDALGGAPGVYSARYAGEPCDDLANCRKVLEALADTPDAGRGAAFRCALAVADPEGTIRLEAEGHCRGRILRELRGEGGFGYTCNIRNPMQVGGYQPPLDPEQPTILSFYTPFHRPGLPARAQVMQGRAELLTTSYPEYERRIHAQMLTLFGAAGFDPRRDVAGLILNRWGHAYSVPFPGFFGGASGRARTAAFRCF